MQEEQTLVGVEVDKILDAMEKMGEQDQSENLLVLDTTKLLQKKFKA
jgi:hypothetical protein